MKIAFVVLLALLLVAPGVALTDIDNAYMQGFQEGCRLMDLFYQGQAGNQTAEQLYLDGIAAINKRAAGNSSELEKFGNQEERKKFDFGSEKPIKMVEADKKDSDLKAWMNA